MALIGCCFLALGAAVLVFVHLLAVAAWLAFLGVLLLLALAIERWRYKPLIERPPGPEWEKTDERFVDPETGRLVTVYHHRTTGERRYIAAPDASAKSR